MSDLTVHRTYCDEHAASDHWLDETYHCHGSSLAEVERRGNNGDNHGY